VQDKICMVTGATAGIGLVTARALAERGAQVVIVGRNPQKGAATVAELRQRTGNERISFLAADLAAQSDVRRLAQAFIAAHPRLDVLVNNAGAMFWRRQISTDGIELTLALNHLNYFLLTGLLLDRLRAAAPARIVNVASVMHRKAALDLDDLQSTRRYDGRRAYANSKLCNILFTAALARRLPAGEVTVNCLHPGFVRSNFGSDNDLWFRIAVRIVMLGGVGVEEGAETSIHLATAPDVAGVTGRYFVKKQPVEPTAAARDAQTGERLWAASEALTGLRYRL
jgi:retinol dehydrogenase 12